MKRTAPTHPKMARLARALSIEKAWAVGLVELLIHFTAEHAPSGDVGRYSDADLADALCWHQEPGALIAALTSSGWLDVCSEHRLVLHGWAEHADDGVHAKVARAHEYFVDGKQPRLRKLEREERARAETFYALHQTASHSAGQGAQLGQPRSPPPPPGSAAASPGSLPPQGPAPDGRPEGGREAADGYRSAPSGASPTPTPTPEEKRSEGEHAADAAHPLGEDEGEPRGDPARWATVLAKMPGSEQEKLTFVREHLLQVELEAVAELPADRRDPIAINAKKRSLLIRYWRQHLKGPRRASAPALGARVQGPRLMQHPPETPQR